MAKSLIEFAKEFERLKAFLADDKISPDLKLIRIAEFRDDNQDSLEKKQYRSYLEELTSDLAGILQKDGLPELYPDELVRIKNMLGDLSQNQPDNDVILSQIDKINHALARIYFYLGEANHALAVCSEIAGIDITENSEPDIPPGINEYDHFVRIRERIGGRNSRLDDCLEELATDWEGAREGLYNDRINCLFVEKGRDGIPARGRMKTLVGDAEYKKGKSGSDQISFDAQIRAPDDPFIGSSYDSLEALRAYIEKGRNGSAKRIHAHFRIEDSAMPYSGDSIGLAVALLSYSQIQKDQNMRQRHMLAGEVAVTGGVDKESVITPVNDRTLELKIRRAFFSMARYMVVPEANIETARECLAKLESKYPHRQLKIIGARWLSELIENRNIVREEKVCIGEFVIRKAYSYSRTARLQVPLLILLITFLAVLIEPRLWPWFDWRIDHIEIYPSKIKAINPDGHTNWEYEDFRDVLNPNDYDNADSRRKYISVIDIDDDNRDELLFVPVYKDISRIIYIFSAKGKLLNTIDPFVPTSYPGDREVSSIEKNHFYSGTSVVPIVDDDNKYLFTIIFASFPGRAQLNLFDFLGRHVSGPYIFPGASKYCPNVFADFNKDGNNDIVLCGTNNRYNAAAVYFLDHMELGGVSPPYNEDLFLLSDLEKGKQLAYISLPESPLSKHSNVRNSVAEVLYNKSTKSYRIRVKEAYVLRISGKRMSEYGPSFYYFLDSNLIPVRVIETEGEGLNMNSLLNRMGQKPIDSFERLNDSLRREVVVYYGDSIVHHEAAGIYFYDSLSTK